MLPAEEPFSLKGIRKPSHDKKKNSRSNNSRIDTRFFWDLPEYKVEKIAKVISKILNKFVYLSKNDS